MDITNTNTAAGHILEFLAKTELKITLDTDIPMVIYLQTRKGNEYGNKNLEVQEVST